MSLDKAIEHNKEKRKPYRGAKAVDATCRNHGSCSYCEENRKHKFRDKGETLMGDEAIRRCGGSWAYCDGDCERCPGMSTWTTNTTNTLEEE